jgi:hypothetical protein
MAIRVSKEPLVNVWLGLHAYPLVRPPAGIVFISKKNAISVSPIL